MSHTATDVSHESMIAELKRLNAALGTEAQQRTKAAAFSATFADSRVLPCSPMAAVHQANKLTWAQLRDGQRSVLEAINKLNQRKTAFDDKEEDAFQWGLTISDVFGVEMDKRTLSGSREPSDQPTLEYRQGLSKAMADAIIGNRGGSFDEPQQWRSSDGNAVRVLRPEQRASEFLDPRDGGFTGGQTVGIGALLRAKWLGPRNDAEARALSEGTDSAGGFTVSRPTLARFIDRLRAATVTVQAGATTVMVESDRSSIARLASDVTASWKAENAASTESDPNFENVLLQPKTLVALTRVSEELLQDSMNIDAVLENSMVNALSVELDRALLFGTGASSQPLGVFNQSGITTLSQGTNGAPLTNWTRFLDAQFELANRNVNGSLAAIMSPRTARTLNGFLDTTNQPLQRPPALNDISMFTTKSVPDTQTQGTSTNASTVLVGNFADLLIGMRWSLRIEVMRELYRNNLQVGFLAFLRADCALAHPESFVRITGIIP